MRHAVNPRHGYLLELLVRPDPQFGVYLRFWNDFAFENVTHEEVIVHCLRDDLCDPSRIEFDESVMF